MKSIRHGIAGLWALAAAICCVWLVNEFAGDAPLETNLLSLLPQTERNARAETAFNALSDTLGNRAIFLIGNQEPANAHTAAGEFAQSLRDAKIFRAVVDEAPRVEANALVDLYRDSRFGLLSFEDRRDLSRGEFDAAKRLQRALHAPFGGAAFTDRGGDPFELFQNWLTASPLAKSPLFIERNRFVARGDGLTWVLVIAELPGSAYDAKIQRSVAAAVNAAERALPARTPATSILKTGSVFYATAARESAERDVDFIGALSLAGILFMLWYLFRSVRPLVLGMSTVLIGIATATAVTIGAHGQLHLLTLVFGASLIGEAIDYAIQYFAAQLGSGSQWEPRAGLHQVLPGLSMALVTSLVGYGVLAMAPFPAIAQIALFAFAGLLSAWISVVLLLPYLSAKKMSRDAEAATRLPRKVLTWWREKANARGVALVVLVVLALSLPGWLALGADDDIRLLVTRPAKLANEEAKIRTISGNSGLGRFFLVEGATVEEVLRREESLGAALSNAPMPVKYTALADFVPSIERQIENRLLIENALLDPSGKTVKLLADAGFRDDVGLKWNATLSERKEQTLFTLTQWRASPMSAPYRHLIAEDANGPVGLLIVQSDAAGSDLAKIGSTIPGVTLVDKGASVSALLREYRQSGALWLPIGVLLVFCIVAMRYGMVAGAAILLPTVLGMVVALALHGYFGVPATLFGVMGLLLTLGVGVNYSIFLLEGGDRSATSFAGVLLSAATTLLSFGLLAFSSMPALQQFGLMMLAGIGTSVLFAPMVLLTERARRVP